ncbi:CoaE-domain-containing protein [Testicularia cyperi]|uniref:CoaE-domain-containing protein n=1 Tax=Testicularia cyperi TaxID=1882483 RepID=A0A317XM32_9BASI|nr:CoaE-domain-containing protein [Testicularia cyperi]
MLIVGLTGGIASGKSTVSYLISQHPARVPIIDLDILAREVVEPGQPALAKLAATFGESVLNPDGSLNRAELGRIAFSEPAKTRQLNKITHGAIRRRMAWQLVKYWLTGHKVVVVDTPLLVEAGLWKMAGEMVLVYCSREDQLKRMLARDGPTKGLTEQDAKQRLDAQLPLDDKLVYADTILDNTSALNHNAEQEGAAAPKWAQSLDRQTSLALRIQVDRMVERWTHRYQGLGALTWLVEWLLPPAGLFAGLWTAYARTSKVQQRLKQGTKPLPPSSKL